MGWDMLAVVLDHMRDRLQAGARADLLEMAQVTYVKSRTARLLWENGFKSLRALAEADPADLVPVLMMVCGLLTHFFPHFPRVFPCMFSAITGCTPMLSPTFDPGLLAKSFLL